MPLDDPKPGDARPKEPQVTDSVAGTFQLLGLDTPPRHIGPYRILDVIGEGAMGIVYLAEQERPIRRKVAIKVLKLGMDTKEILARFEAEQQALALMDHPGIATIFDAGAMGHGRPYFVMEHVQGTPITHYSDERRLTTRERLGLFARVCKAVQHAHEKGVVHRDLKPSNILVVTVDGEPTPKVIDFGVAKALHQQLTEKTLFTAEGRMIGTPAYMSPEQASLTPSRIGVTTDVYSLGIVLYELMVGVTPLDTDLIHEEGLEAFCRLIREEDTSRPSTRLGNLGDRAIEVAEARKTTRRDLERGLRGELDWIALKALEKSPEDRYASCRDLAQDVESFLDGRTVVARPRSVVYRSKKMLARYRTAVAYALAVASILAVAGILLFRPEPLPVTPVDGSLAVVGTRSVTSPPDSVYYTGLLDLIERGLGEFGICSMLEPDVLENRANVQFNRGIETVDLESALDLAWGAGSGLAIEVSVERYLDGHSVSWKIHRDQGIVESSRQSIAGASVLEAADQVLHQVIPLLSSRCGTISPDPLPSVSQFTTSSPEAFLAYTKGWMIRVAGQGGEVEFFEEAVAADTTFALAYLVLSQSQNPNMGRDLSVVAADRAWGHRSRLPLRDRLRLEAWRARVQDDWKQSADTYREILTRWPYDRQSLEAFIDLLLFGHFFEEALEVAVKALNGYDDDGTFLRSRAWALGYMGEEEEAIGLVRHLAERDPENPGRWVGLSHMYIFAGRLDSAEIVLERAHSVGLGEDVFTGYMGRIELARGQVRKIIEEKEAGLALDQGPTQRLGLLYDIAELYSRLGQYRKAMGLLDGAEELAVGTTSERMYYGGICTILAGSKKKEHHEQALAAMEEMAKLDLGFFAWQVPWRRAWILARMGRAEEAREELAKAEALKTWARIREDAIQLIWPMIAMAEGRPERAVEIYEGYFRGGASPILRGGILLGLARAYRYVGEVEKSRELLLKLLAYTRAEILAYYELGITCQELKRWGEAEAAFSEFLEYWSEADPDLPRLIDAKQRLEQVRTAG